MPCTCLTFQFKVILNKQFKYAMEVRDDMKYFLNIEYLIHSLTVLAKLIKPKNIWHNMALHLLIKETTYIQLLFAKNMALVLEG